MPTPLTDADKVLRNDTGKAIVEKLDDIANAISAEVPDELSELRDVNISSPTSNQALVYNPVTQKWENGEVSTVGGLNDLNDVNIDDTSLAQGQELVYNPDTQKWENAMIPQTGTIEDVAIASFSDGADDVPVSGLIFDIEARQEGSGTPSPDNVRAISGFDSGVITRSGKNLFSYDFQLYSGYWMGDGLHDGSPVSYDEARSWCFYLVPVKSGEKITLSGMQATGGVYGAFLDTTPNNVISRYLNANANNTFTVPEGANLMGIIINRGVSPNLVDVKTAFPNAQIEIGETATTYEPYNGNTYTVDFGQTVYGGHFDNKGNLVVTHGIVDLGTLTWTKVTSFTNILFLATVTGKATNNSNIICSNYNNVGIATGGTFLNNMANNSIASDTATGIYIRDDAKSSLSAADFKTAMSGVMLVYKLDGGPSFPVAGQDVRTLLGNNNIFVNTGNIRRLEYFKTGCENIAKLIEAAPNLASVQSVNGQTGAVELDAFNTPYDSENSIAEKVEKLTVKLTLAEYNALTEKAPNTRYIITDAPALEYTAEDLSYDGGTETTKQKIEEKANITALPFVKYEQINVALDNTGEGTLFTSNKLVVGIKDIPSDSLYVGYAVYYAGSQTKAKALARNSLAFTSGSIISQTRKVGVYYLDNISVT